MILQTVKRRERKTAALSSQVPTSFRVHGLRDNFDGTLQHPLTGRQREILRLIGLGLANKEVARQLSISVSTVERHVANVYAKTDTHGRAEAVHRALELGLPGQVEALVGT
jgi:DNA-binding NarL/FixJ family response regulator